MKTLFAMMVAAFLGCPLFGALTDGLVAHYKFDGNTLDSQECWSALAGTSAGMVYIENRKGMPNSAVELKSFSATVNGVVVDGLGYGTATIKKFGSVPVTIE